MRTAQQGLLGVRGKFYGCHDAHVGSRVALCCCVGGRIGSWPL
jgi:hypothetical protein